MALTSRYPSSSSYQRRFPLRRTPRAMGTRFQARKFTGRVSGREVPYYVGPGREAHVFDSPVRMNFTTSAAGNSKSQTSADLSVLLNAIHRGTGIYDRESQRASMKYVLFRLRCALTMPEDTGTHDPSFSLQTSPVTLRVILVYSTNWISQINPADFLSTPGDPGLFGPYWATSAVQRIDSREQHQILYDNKFVVRNTDGSTPQPPVTTPSVKGDFTFRDLDLKIPVLRPVSYTATSVSPITLSDITSGALHLMVIADQLFTDSNHRIDCQVVGSARLIFAP